MSDNNLECDLIVRAFEPGSTVTIVEEQRRAIVNSVCIYARGGVLYEIAYWKDGQRITTWVNGRELSSDESKKRIGFKAPE